MYADPQSRVLWFDVCLDQSVGECRMAPWRG